jgi:glutathione S-transferase
MSHGSGAEVERHERLSDISVPVLWQLEISHYNEKVRWALDYKRIPHVRRSLLPGLHAAEAKRLTGDISTTPVLTLDDRAIGDSTRIIAAIEDRWPQLPLYPQDPTLRRRALELEEFFDEELGPHIRRVFYEALMSRPDLLVPLFTRGDPHAAGTMLQGFAVFRTRIRERFELTAEATKASRAKVMAAIDRLERELEPSGFLVGETFTIADLTAAALSYAIVRPPEFPYRMVTYDNLPETWRSLVDPLAQRPGGRWIADTYRRHRGRSAEVKLGRPAAAPANDGG